jgi:hypothetical protein
MHVVHVNASHSCYSDYVCYVFQWSNDSLSGDIWIFTTTPPSFDYAYDQCPSGMAPMTFFFFLFSLFSLIFVHGSAKFKSNSSSISFLDLVYVLFISACSILNHRIEIFLNLKVTCHSQKWYSFDCYFSIFLNWICFSISSLNILFYFILFLF